MCLYSFLRNFFSYGILHYQNLKQVAFEKIVLKNMYFPIN